MSGMAKLLATRLLLVLVPPTSAKSLLLLVAANVATRHVPLAFAAVVDPDFDDVTAAVDIH